MADGMNFRTNASGLEYLFTLDQPVLLRLPGSAKNPICQGADFVFQKSVHASMNLPFSYLDWLGLVS